MKVNLINSKNQVLATDVNRLHDALVHILSVNHATHYTIMAALKEMSVDGQLLLCEPEQRAIVKITDGWFEEILTFESEKLSNKIDKLIS